MRKVEDSFGVRLLGRGDIESDFKRVRKWRLGLMVRLA